MSAITTQPALFTEAEMAASAELDRQLDRALCQQYFQAWITGGMNTSVTTNGITFADFQTAGDRLAAAAV